MSLKTEQFADMLGRSTAEETRDYIEQAFGMLPDDTIIDIVCKMTESDEALRDEMRDRLE